MYIKSEFSFLISIANLLLRSFLKKKAEQIVKKNRKPLKKAESENVIKKTYKKIQVQVTYFPKNFQETYVKTGKNNY